MGMKPLNADELGDLLSDTEADLERLRAKVRWVRDQWQAGDDKCWKDLEELFKLLPEGYEIPKRDSRVELKLCEQYIASCHHPGVEYVSPQRRIEELEAEVVRLKADLAESQKARSLLTRELLEADDD
jgi:uncharacterized coiled-coil protein SlyX